MKIDFRTAAVTISEGIVTAIFRDGTENVMNTHWLNQDWYKQIARDQGFGEDWQFYAYTHELTHHWVADRLAWNASWAVYENVQYRGEMPAHIAWEEHIVNKLQRYVMTEQPDEYCVLDAVFGDTLKQARLELLLLYARVK
jgi:hypothetical protein